MRIWHGLFLSALLVGSASFAQDVVVIVNPSNETTLLSQKDLQRIYANNMSHWRNGTRVIPVTLESGSIHDAFLMRHLRKNHHQFSLLWKRLLFSGNGVPPISFASEEEVIAFVTRTPGAIAYVSDKAALKGVVALRIQREPL